MAAESPDRQARVRRTRQANVAGGRPHSHRVKLSDAENDTLTKLAEAAGVTIPRLLVEAAAGARVAESGRAAAAMQLLEFDNEIRAIGNNLNQLTRYTHQDRDLAEGLEDALRAVTRACLRVDATARWVMGLSPAVTAVSISEDDDAAEDEWADAVDPEDA